MRMEAHEIGRLIAQAIQKSRGSRLCGPEGDVGSVTISKVGF